MTYLRQMKEIRALEEQISRLLTKAVLKGASHLYAGQEASRSARWRPCATTI
jgi:TPP-dependent pyruvate/acetoin dehydrogenase alpha subunit